MMNGPSMSQDDCMIPSRSLCRLLTETDMLNQQNRAVACGLTPIRNPTRSDCHKVQNYSQSDSRVK